MNKKNCGYLFLFFIIFIFDFFSKQWALENCRHTLDITSWLAFAVSLNRGISWSLFDSEQPFVFYLLTFLIASIIAFLIHYTRQRWKKGKSIVGEVFVLAGACANLIDRLIHHGVVDFIVIHYKNLIWPIFNIADLAIIIGIIFMVWETYE
ncbi:MAG: signal peptidase II [Candidatus Babeliaceae bacterium]